MKRNETRGEYETNLGEKRPGRGSRGYMVNTRGCKKECPDAGQEESGGAPHGGNRFDGGMNGERRSGGWGGIYGTKEEEQLSTISVGPCLDPVDTGKIN